MAQMMLLNPRKRKPAKRRAAPKRKTATRRAPVRKRRVARKVKRASSARRYRRNPIRGRNQMKGIMEQMTNAAMSATGAIGLDVAMGALTPMMPVALQVGMARHATKAVGAVILGMIGGAVLPKATAKTMAEGALTVVFHDAMKEQLTTFVPNLTLGGNDVPYYPSAMPEPGMGYASPAMVTDQERNMGEYVQEDYAGMGEYVDNSIYR